MINSPSPTTSTQPPPQTPLEPQQNHEDVIGTAHSKLHPTANEPHKRIVAIALDASESASYAFDWALKNLVRAESDHLVLLST
jgi:hypothetical protein